MNILPFTTLMIGLVLLGGILIICAEWISLWFLVPGFTLLLFAAWVVVVPGSVWPWTGVR